MSFIEEKQARRENNRIADFLVNYTMDVGTGWQRDVPPALSDFSVLEANFIVHSDGGTRAGSCSAAAWFAEAVVWRGGRRHLFPLRMCGVYIETPVSSFSAEALALEDAVNYLSQLLLLGRAAKHGRVQINS